MKKIYLLLLVGGILTACGGSTNDTKKDGLADGEAKEQKDDKPEVMSFEQGLKYNKSDRKLVEVEGYVQLSVVSNFSKNGQTVDFYGRRNQKGGAAYYTTMPVGNGKNQMKQLPKEYKSSDVSMTDDSGNTVGANQRVKLTGYLYTLGTTTYLDVTGIDKVDEKAVDYESLNFKKLEEKHTSDNNAADKGYWIEGRMSIPMFVLVDDETTVDIKDKSGKSFSLKLTTGTEAGQIEELGEGWTDRDVKIRTGKGKLVNLNQNVKVYGVLKLDGLHVEEIVQ